MSKQLDFKSYKQKLEIIRDTISEHNFRELKDELIGLQQQIKMADLDRNERFALREIIDLCFQSVHYLRGAEQRAREEESRANAARLSQLVDQALSMARDKQADLNQAWDFCIEVQQEFRGIRMKPEEREHLYQRLQQAFDLVKQLRAQQRTQRQLESQSEASQLEPRILQLRKEAETSMDTSGIWERLILLQDQIRDQIPDAVVRRSLLDQLQDAFETIKIRRGEEHEQKARQVLAEVGDPAQSLAQLERDIDSQDSFHELFNRLRLVQDALKLSPANYPKRDYLLERVNLAFDTLKVRQDSWYEKRREQAKENYERMKPLIEAAHQRAQGTMEFKKTREALIRLQASFKGIVMDSAERQSLYSKLQTSFDILNQRHQAYLESKRDKIQLHVNYQLSDVALKVAQIQDEIDRDHERISQLRDTGENPLHSLDSSDPAQDITNQIKLLETAIARREQEKSELLAQQQRLSQKKDQWEDPR